MASLLSEIWPVRQGFLDRDMREAVLQEALPLE